MIYRALADLLVAVHFGFILFVVLGGLFVLRWPRSAWVHLPAAIWGIWIAATGGVCPLTPLENALRRAAGETAYAGGFIERYLLPVIYPPGLTPGVQRSLAAIVVVVNVAVYLFALRRARSR